MDRRGVLKGLFGTVALCAAPTFVRAEESSEPPKTKDIASDIPDPEDQTQNYSPPWDGIQEGLAQRGAQPDPDDEQDTFARKERADRRSKDKRGPISGSIRARGGSGSRDWIGVNIRIGGGK